MWPALPIEFNVLGTPVSVNSSGHAKKAWQHRVREAAKATIDPAGWSLRDQRLAVTLFYFPQTTMGGDLDNIIKWVLDALSPNIYADDSMIDRIVAQRFTGTTRFPIEDPSFVLAEAMANETPVLYIRIDEVAETDAAP